MPDCRDPLPDLPLPPNGRCASAPDVELLTLTMPALIPRRNRNASFGVGGVDRRRQPVARQVREPDRVVEVAVRRHADQRTERLVAEDLVVLADAVDDRRVVEDAGVRVADETVAGVRRRDPAGRRRSPSTVWCGWIQPR